MELEGKIIVVTGGARGIGRGLCARFAQEQPEAIWVTDIDADTVEATARELGAVARTCDVALEDDVRQLVSEVMAVHGRIDLFCANAGIAVSGGIETPDDEWRRIMDVNVLSHLYCARAVIPSMLQRGSGYLLHTASAAGLLTQIGSAPYSVSKHAAVALAEWLSITYGDRGINVSCLCPQGVRTAMLDGEDPVIQSLRAGSLSIEEVAESVVAGLREERFLILPHAEVGRYFQNKANDYDRWLRGLRRLRREICGPPAETPPDGGGG
ncbi:MAG: SDR family oxidoreductase [Planctomycetaceae bacterium]|nr:SDR family oxidoreductase [Planctomycetaceae bacterium]